MKVYYILHHGSGSTAVIVNAKLMQAAQMKKAKREKAFDYLLCDPEAKKDTKLKG